MGRVVEAVESGAHVVAAARAAGVHVSTLYRWRRQVVGFAEAWDAAAAKSSGPVLIAAGNGRALQKRRSRRVRFTCARKEAFLAHFARTCDAEAAAAEAGVCHSTVYKHLRADSAFAEAWQEAMEMGHQLLRAELVAEQMAARARYKKVPVAARRAADAGAGSGQADAEAAGRDFERGLKLLESWQRREDSAARRAGRNGGGRPKWWDEEPPDEEMQAEILRRLAAIRRHRQAQAGEAGDDGSGAGDWPSP
jgi:transposase-like protein